MKAWGTCGRCTTKSMSTQLDNITEINKQVWQNKLVDCIWYQVRLIFLQREALRQPLTTSISIDFNDCPINRMRTEQCRRFSGGETRRHGHFGTAANTTHQFDHYLHSECGERLFFNEKQCTYWKSTTPLIVRYTKRSGLIVMTRTVPVDCSTRWTLIHNGNGVCFWNYTPHRVASLNCMTTLQCSTIVSYWISSTLTRHDWRRTVKMCRLRHCVIWLMSHWTGLLQHRSAKKL